MQKLPSENRKATTPPTLSADDQREREYVTYLRAHGVTPADRGKTQASRLADLASQICLVNKRRAPATAAR